MVGTTYRSIGKGQAQEIQRDEPLLWAVLQADEEEDIEAALEALLATPTGLSSLVRFLADVRTMAVADFRADQRSRWLHDIYAA